MMSGYRCLDDGTLDDEKKATTTFGRTTTVNATVINKASATLTIDQLAAVFNKAVTNDGTFKWIDANATFTAAFTNNGVMILPNSIPTLTFAALTEGASGVIEAWAGDISQISGKFLNQRLRTRPGSC